jgi:hypothetical protein
MKKLLFILIVSSILFHPLYTFAKSFYSDGQVDNASGTPSKELRFADFEVSEDKSVTGYIINDSNRPLAKVRLDMWITNISNTRILWRKIIDVGDLAPKARVAVKEMCDLGNYDEPSKVQFFFKIPSNSNFRNTK